MRVKFPVLALIVALGFAAAVQATPIIPFNDRSPNVPVAAGNDGLPQSDLQTILNGVYGAAAPDARTGQDPAGMWGFSSVPGSSIPTMVVEWAGNAPYNVFGIWFGTDSSDLFLYDMLLGPATAGLFADAASLQIAGNTLLIGPGGSSACGVQVNCTGPLGVTNSLITPNSFGFYLRNRDGQVYYSVDQLNPQGGAYELSFHGTTAARETWIMAFEDVPLNANSDYNDMVVKVESITAVPEPGSMLLLGSGLLALLARRRR